jgi:hypothetical protein
MSLSLRLSKILNLVGKLDDAPGDQAPRERFRNLIREEVKEIGQLRDLINEALANNEIQYSRALQDLVNHLGTFLGFSVNFGRYQGVQGELGHDGLWSTPEGFSIVVEVKTSENFPIQTSKLTGYIAELISQHQIADWQNALGLYVIGRPDPNVKQLENAIVAEKNVHPLRIVSVVSLLTLADMMSEHGLTRDDVLALLRPSGPTVDTIVDTINHVLAQSLAREAAPSPIVQPAPSQAPAISSEETPFGGSYWLTPVADDEDTGESAEQIVDTLVVQRNSYAFAETTPNKGYLRPGDHLCFYASGRGVVAHATIASGAEKRPGAVSDSYPWVISTKDPKFYPKDPVVVDLDLRRRLNVFQSRNPAGAWGWFVVTMRAIDKHDFELLTRQ